ncbi:hypothetical protein ILUMI_21919 [Ignelater luminosus]|uniref:Uncharacterized protein n=1 Tax=Ignelater luminosus TaxID=2038154 RepID=A0A8K0CFD9_IGNLU|nr:hypothetical protein ILUMI_21919 [Ignelater luminosus]
MDQPTVNYIRLEDWNPFEELMGQRGRAGAIKQIRRELPHLFSNMENCINAIYLATPAEPPPPQLPSGCDNTHGAPRAPKPEEEEEKQVPESAGGRLSRSIHGSLRGLTLTDPTTVGATGVSPLVGSVNTILCRGRATPTRSGILRALALALSHVCSQRES